MPGYDFYEALGRIAEFSHRAETPIVDTLGVGSRSNSARGHRMQFDGSQFQVIGFHQEGRFILSYIYKLSERVANTLSVKESRELLTDEENQALGDEQAVHLAAKKRVAALEEGDIQDALKAVDDELEPFHSRMNTQVMEMDGQELWDGFEVWDNIYPRDEAFTVQDYESTIKQVVREGRIAAGVLTDALGLVDNEELREIQPDDDGGPGRGFA